MWPSKSKAEEATRLREVLDRVRQFVERSSQSNWTSYAPAEISADLGAAISRLEQGELVATDHLRMLFAPTGPIQETAMSNKWPYDYLKLSSEFDDLIKSLTMHQS